MYFAPYIDSSGVHLPTYQDRLDALTASYQTIFGPETNLEISSPDYQLLSVFARALDDLSQLILADFNARNPQYAAGTALDLLLPLAGLTRSGATRSTVQLTLTGTPGAVLPAAPEVLDDAGYLWKCPAPGITLNENGIAVVTASCATPGAVSAPAGSVRRLVSPVPGLSSAVNASAAVPGTDAETDASCRNRLRLAAAAPAVSTLEALRSAVAAVPNVKACAVYENSSDSTDANGIPAHSVCVVAAGGLTAALAPVIFAKKAPGVGTYGGTSASVTDAWGTSHVVRFQRATQTPVALPVELKPLAGFDSSVTEKIKTALTDYGNTLGIGQDLVVPSLSGVVFSADESRTPTFSVSLLTASVMGEAYSGIVPAAWNQRFTFYANMIQVVVASS